MEVRAKKSLGQHFLTDLSVAQRIVAALGSGADGSGEQGLLPEGGEPLDVLEIGPGMGVLTRYLLERKDIRLKLVELDGESVEFLMSHFNGLAGKLHQADYLKLDVHRLFSGKYSVIGNFPYNISSQIFFKILDDRDRVPEVVCMVQKEVAERIAEGPGSKTYGILSVLLQAWYDIEYLFTVEPGAFAPPPKVRSAVIRLRRNTRTKLLAGEAVTRPDGKDGQAICADKTGSSVEIEEKQFRLVVKTAFGQRRKTLRNALRALLPADFDLTDPVLGKRAEQLGVEDFIALSARIFRK